MSQDLPDPSSQAPAWKGYPPMMHGVPVYLDTALWRQTMELQQARDEGEALWLHGFMCGLAVALVVAAVAFWRRRR